MGYDMGPAQWVIPESNKSKRTNDCMCKTRISVPKTDGFGDEFYDILVASPFFRRCTRSTGTTRSSPRLASPDSRTSAS